MIQPQIKLFLSLVSIMLLTSIEVRAWSESGHAIITYLAYKRLPIEKKKALAEIIKQHPKWKEDFTPLPELTDVEEQTKWRIGRIGHWPDEAREYEEYNRPTWHYQLGASMTMGRIDGIAIPKDPVKLPDDATMQTQELHILQALELCRNVLKDRTEESSQRALAMCWVAHLVADLHQPCHSGSLYAPFVFADDSGDRGANRIRVGEQPLHAFWDQLLGNLYEKGDVNRRIYELTSDRVLMNRALTAMRRKNPQDWLRESRSIATQNVYAAEVQQAVRVAIESRQSTLASH